MSFRRFAKSTLLLAGLCPLGGVASAQAPQPSEARTFESVAEAVEETMRNRLYDPRWIADPAFRRVEDEIAVLATQPQTREAFVAGFNAIWGSGPFSHVQLAVARGSAEQTAAHLDQLRVGGSGARLSWQGEVAVLTVSTMMGLDTIEQVDAAFEEIATGSARALVLDLRENQGGAFVSRALVSHLIQQPRDLGVFASRSWHATQTRAPEASDAQALEPWAGWSLSSFWRDVQGQPLTRIRVQPVAPLFTGPVAVLISRRTASAAELTADALRARDDVVLVGEPSAGRMLSQAPHDLPEGLQLMLPVADYFSARSGRIEGHGLKPDIEVAADQAMQVALAHLTQ